MDTVGWIILIVVAVVMIIPSIFLINGKGAWLIAGYNTMSPERKSQYDEKALCKFTGWLLLIYTIGLFLGMILLIYGIDILGGIIMVLIHVILVGAIVYINTGSRLKKIDNSKE